MESSLFSELDILNKYKVNNSIELYENKKKEILSNLNSYNLDEIKENRTPLLYAIQFKHNLEDFTEEFVKTGNSNPGYIPPTPNSNTALIDSILNHLEKVAFAILRTGEGKPEYTNIYGNTALLCAVSNKYEDLAIEIINTGKSNPGVPYIKRGMLTTTPLMSAINLKLIKVALEIAKTGQSNPGYTINNENALTLAYSSHNDKYDFKEVMLEIIRTGDEKCLGFVPTHTYGNSVLILFLLNEKLSPGWRYSHRHEDNTDIIELIIKLIQSGYSNPGHINNDGKTALIIACENKLSHIAIELINTGKSNPSHVSSTDSMTALMIACENDMDNVAIAILRTGDSNYKYSFDNYSALTIAIDNNLDEIEEEITRLDSIGIRGFLERLKSDPIFNKLDTLLNQFNHKENTIKNKSQVIGDNILKDITNPYLVHYEEFEGKSYPIITILKGTTIFTARKLASPSISESYYHLYKLHNNPTLDDYMKQNLENVLTYFFPVPHISHYVFPNYITMDMVVLTKDVRLLCVMSPSPLCRDIKLNSDLYIDPNGSKYYTNNDINACPKRDYDLCISNHLIMGLKLNGYIGIAHDDSMTKHFKIEQNFKSSQLFLSGCFNNAIYPQKAGKDFVENMIYNRTYGIPEIVLIPYDLHAYGEPTIYENVYSTWTHSLKERQHLNEVDDSHFIFKYVDQVNGKNSIDIGKKMAQRLSLYDGTTKPKLEKSLQAYPLFNVFAEEIEERNKDYILGDKQITFDDIAFTSSYIESPSSKCAFETNTFYVELEKLVSNTSGGSVDILSGYKEIPMKKSVIAVKSKSKINKTQKTYSNKYPIDTEDIYYNEVNRVPIVVYKTNKLIDMSKISRTNAGGTQKSRTQKRKTKKTKNTNRKRTQKH